MIPSKKQVQLTVEEVDGDHYLEVRMELNKASTTWVKIKAILLK